MKADIGRFESDLKYAAYCTRVVLFSLYTILISVLSNVLLVNKLISNIKKICQLWTRNAYFSNNSRWDQTWYNRYWVNVINCNDYDLKWLKLVCNQIYILLFVIIRKTNSAIIVNSYIQKKSYNNFLLREIIS